MVRVKISNFIKNNKNKIADVVTKLIMVAIVVLIATIILSFNSTPNSEEQEEVKEIYKPKETVIIGSDISTEQYESDNDVVKIFLKYCNNKEIDKAYSIISEECKNELYPDINTFKNNYYDYIFKQNREYNLQSWISNKKYTVYKIRYTNNMISTGQYEENNVYQDYITLIKNSESNSVSLGSFIMSEKYTKGTQTEGIEANILNRNIYVDCEEYEISIKNNTENTILIDNLKQINSIKLFDDSNNGYDAYINKLFASDLMIEPGRVKKVKVKFKKMLSGEQESKYIQFSNVIKNYNTNQENNNTVTIKINV